MMRAPFAGVILERPVDPGQTVGLESIIYRIADLSSPEVSIDVDEVYAAEIQPGIGATISFAGQNRPLAATVLHVGPRIDPATGARTVRLRLVNALAEAPSGLTVTVNLLIEHRKSAISVPRRAIIESGSRASVRMCGADDNDNGSADRLAEALPDARRATIPGTHMSSVTKPELGVALVAFLAG